MQSIKRARGPLVFAVRHHLDLWLPGVRTLLVSNLRPRWLFVLSLDFCYCLSDPFMSSSPACFCELDSHLSDLFLPSGSLAWPTLPALILLMPSSEAWFDSLVVTYHLSEPLWVTVIYKNTYSTTLSSLEITWKSKNFSQDLFPKKCAPLWNQIHQKALVLAVRAHGACEM